MYYIVNRYKNCYIFYMLKASEYVKVVRRPYPPFWNSLQIEGIGTLANYRALFPKDSYTTKNTLKLTDGSIYYSIKDIENGGRVTFKNWMKPAGLRRAEKIFRERENILTSAARGEDLRKLVDAYMRYTVALVVFMADEPVATAIQKKLEVKVGKDKADTLLHYLNIPLKDNFYKLEEYDLVKSKNLERHVKKYQWIKSRYGLVHSYTLREARENLSKIDKKLFLKKRRAEKRLVKKAIAEAKRALKRDARLVDLMQFIIYYRTHRTDVLNKASYLFAPTLKKIATEKGLTYQEILYVTKNELLGKLPAKSVIRSRMSRHVVLRENGIVRCLSGRAAERIENIFVVSVSQMKELKGTVAASGYVKGVVKVVFQLADLKKVKHGDVLVTSMTTPNMVPAMKKACAFVTDEGGITCHAAIIAREMGKPCIIGTKIATKVLKDGDLVEVDANSGVVKIIKKA